ncbi:hypothetical protein DICPUDRAFT_77361 [Dictyostelium purpureum]|uniref:Uncharacterized protein n=1 Tax=Dictyostelium purpureum TaxID=5786 RepID=F0ZGD9_DICPU|nr:uncharacterized protein DICPUDRAFT_77361 [Dictyostelium purpureum]EGC36979.1 hypothetical protein DICPUDRAFT_77361 [Dictyostelium purpureum]|eukprot:XP_003286476.1 hypothetical protein DICPUDRAFT_77361 [Dictyostelium purpureum]
MDINNSEENDYRNEIDRIFKDNIKIHPQDAHVNTVGNMSSSDGEIYSDSFSDGSVNHIYHNQMSTSKLIETHINTNRFYQFKEEQNNDFFDSNENDYDSFLIKTVNNLKRIHIQAFKEFKSLYNKYCEYRIAVDGRETIPNDLKLLKIDINDDEITHFYEDIKKKYKDIDDNDTINSDSSVITTTTTLDNNGSKIDNNDPQNILEQKNQAFIKEDDSSNSNTESPTPGAPSAFDSKKRDLDKFKQNDEEDPSAFTERETHLLKKLKKSREEKEIRDELHKIIDCLNEPLTKSKIKNKKKISKLNEIILKKDEEIRTLQNKFDESLEKANQIELRNSQLEKEKEKLLSYHQEKALEHKESLQTLQDPNNEIGSQNPILNKINELEDSFKNLKEGINNNNNNN